MPNPPLPQIKTHDLRWVTCSLCGEDALGESMMRHRRLLPKKYRRWRYITVRVFDRPRCNECVAAAGAITHVGTEDRREYHLSDNRWLPGEDG